MKRRAMVCAILAAVLLFISGCVVAEGPRGRRLDSYYYYPEHEIYFYPRVAEYYWFERGDWRHGPKPPPRFVLRDRDRVQIDADREPHNDHDRYRKSYPPGRQDRDERRDDKKDDRR